MRPPVRDDLKDLEGYHSAQVDVRVRLNTNESPVPPPEGFTAALGQAMADVAWHRYPDRRAMALRRAIAGLHDVEPEQVFVANGSNEVLQTVLLTYSGAGRRVLTFEPTYQLHAHLARIAGATVVESERSADFTLDAASAVEAVRRADPAVTFLCSPNNPTGVVDPPEVIDAVVAAAPGVVIVDEAYGQFTSRSALSIFDEERPVAISRTFSKTWSMAAARLGYLVAPTWMVERLEQVVLPYHLDAVKQLAGRLAVEHVAEMEARVKAIVDERERLVTGLGQLPVDIWPSGANFVLFRPRGRSGAAVWQGLVDRSVLVRDCSSWPRLDDCLRVTIGTPEEDDEFLAALAEVLS